MGIVHQLQFAFSVVDAHTLAPVPTATAYDMSPLSNPLLKKGKGIFVYLKSAPARFCIGAVGYLTQELTFDPQTQAGEHRLIKLQYAADHVALRGMDYLRFTLRKGETLCAKQTFSLDILGKIGQLRAIAPVQAGDTSLQVNGGYCKPCVFSTLFHQQQVLSLGNYDHETDRYALCQPATADIPLGALLSPRLTLTSDAQGTAIFPLEPLFLQDGILHFSAFGETYELTPCTGVNDITLSVPTENT